MVLLKSLSKIGAATARDPAAIPIIACAAYLSDREAMEARKNQLPSEQGIVAGSDGVAENEGARGFLSFFLGGVHL